MASDSRRLGVALLATLGLGVALGLVTWALSSVGPVTGPDTSVGLTVAMMVAAIAGFLAVLLRLQATGSALVVVVLPVLGAVAGFLLVGGVLYGLGGGDPLRGPAFALAQFGFPGIYVVAVLSAVAAAGYLMGTSPHRTGHSRRVG